MAACEKCWSEYKQRLYWGEHVTYSQVVAENDNAGHTPEEQCGDLHVIVGESCRCGKRRAGEPLHADD